MKRNTIIIFCLAVTAVFLLSFIPVNSSQLTIRINNIQQQKGTISIIIFNSKDGWPNEYKKAVYAKGIPANSKELSQTVKNLPYGTYAIAVLHDINDNKVADKSMFGIPQEPFGFSNYPKITYGVPDFEDVAFEVKSLQQEIVIKMMEI
jgi:uncharacterized protein (DUF2141 family)